MIHEAIIRLMLMDQYLGATHCHFLAGIMHEVGYSYHKMKIIHDCSILRYGYISVTFLLGDVLFSITLCMREMSLLAFSQPT